MKNITTHNLLPELGLIFLSSALGGVILALLVASLAFILHHDGRMSGYLAFLTFEVATVFTGLVANRQPLGRVGLGLSSTLLLLSLALLER